MHFSPNPYVRKGFTTRSLQYQNESAILHEAIVKSSNERNSFHLISILPFQYYFVFIDLINEYSLYLKEKKRGSNRDISFVFLVRSHI